MAFNPLGMLLIATSTFACGFAMAAAAILYFSPVIPLKWLTQLCEEWDIQSKNRGNRCLYCNGRGYASSEDQ